MGVLCEWLACVMGACCVSGWRVWWVSGWRVVCVCAVLASDIFDLPVLPTDIPIGRTSWNAHDQYDCVS